MTPKQIELVQSTWAHIAPQSVHAAEVFYSRLFQLEPTLRYMFPPDMSLQRRTLMEMLNFVVNGLYCFDALVSEFKELGRRHVDYGVEEWQYDLVREALLGMLGEKLGERFTPEVEAAWAETYDRLADVMKSAAYAAV